MTTRSIVLKFLLLFFGFFIFPFPFDFIPGFEYVDEVLYNTYHLIVPWIGKNILHLEKEITVFTNGSGDTTFDYVLVALFACTAFTGSMLWMTVEKKGVRYEKLSYWFFTLLRYYLGSVMLSYE